MQFIPLLVSMQPNGIETAKQVFVDRAGTDDNSQSDLVKVEAYKPDISLFDISQQ
jgi:hypothetical protein